MSRESEDAQITQQSGLIMAPVARSAQAQAHLASVFPTEDDLLQT